MKTSVKSLFSLLLTVLLVISLVACQAKPTDTDQEETPVAPTQEEDAELSDITYFMLQLNALPSDEGLKNVEDALNTITEEQIGTHINFEMCPPADYQTNIVLRHASGEPCDIFLEAIPDAVASGRAADITDLVDEYASGAIDKLGECSYSREVAYSACFVNDRCYGIPVNQANAIGSNWIYRKDLIEDAGIEIGEINSLSDLTPIFDQLHASYPDIYPTYIMGNSMQFFIFSFKNDGLDFLSESPTFNITGACLLGPESQENLEVVSLYESDYFKNAANATRDWYLKGYISPDSVTASEGNASAMASGQFASCFANGQKDQGVSMSSSTGYDIGIIDIGNFCLDTSSYNSVAWVISSGCKDPIAALKLLDLTYTNEEINNLVRWGIEGEDYIVLDNGQVTFPEGLDGSSVPYTSYHSSYFGTQYLAYQMEGTPEGNNERLIACGKNSDVSNAMGFVFDRSVVFNEITAVDSVVDQYMPGIITGALDLDTEYDKFISAMYDAGLKKVIDAKQEQLDAWAETHK